MSKLEERVFGKEVDFDSLSGDEFLMYANRLQEFIETHPEEYRQLLDSIDDVYD